MSPAKNKGVRHAHVTDKLYAAAQNLAKQTGMKTVQPVADAGIDLGAPAVAVRARGEEQRVTTRASSSVQFGTAHMVSGGETRSAWWYRLESVS
jgi:hypothetical protein